MDTHKTQYGLILFLGRTLKICMYVFSRFIQLYKLYLMWKIAAFVFQEFVDNINYHETYCKNKDDRHYLINTI